MKCPVQKQIGWDEQTKQRAFDATEAICDNLRPLRGVCLCETLKRKVGEGWLADSELSYCRMLVGTW